MKFIDFEKLAALFLKYWDKFLIDGVSYTLALAAITVAFWRGVRLCAGTDEDVEDTAAAVAVHHLHRDHPRHAHAAAAVFFSISACPC